MAINFNEIKDRDIKQEDDDLIAINNSLDDTIVALATPVGSGGVAVVRVSGDENKILEILRQVLQKPVDKIKPRYAYYTNFYSSKKNKSNLKSEKEILDKGVVLYFAAPRSYTGENVLEFHCHGGPVVVDRIISEILKYNTRLAEPGEFTKRAWLNGKMDLAQVEAVSDLINATSEQAASSAVNTLNGQFSDLINNFLDKLISLRVYIEAAIDFSDQEIDFINDGQVVSNLNELKANIANLLESANQGVILQEGVCIAIAGEPNAGKSSLLNALCRKEEAIVTAVPGTTRDIIKSNLNIKGVPVSLIDTAGLRETDDIVEQEGIKRAYENISKADFVLLVIDSSDNVNQVLNNNIYQDLLSKYYDKVCIVFNKIDKVENKTNIEELEKTNNLKIVKISAKEKIGIDKLEDFILSEIGYKQTNEGKFIARRRHLQSLQKVQLALDSAQEYLNNNVSHDLIAEELRAAQDYLGEITGEFTPDELLGNIFSSFCIGK